MASIPKQKQVKENEAIIRARRDAREALRGLEHIQMCLHAALAASEAAVREIRRKTK
jgi:hypothetical protein